MNNKPFKLPEAFLKQLKEFTKGYYLITLNDQDEFETFTHFPNFPTQLGLLEFTNIQTTAAQEVFRQQAIDSSFNEEDED